MFERLICINSKVNWNEECPTLTYVVFSRKTPTPIPTSDARSQLWLETMNLLLYVWPECVEENSTGSCHTASGKASYGADEAPWLELPMRIDGRRIWSSYLAATQGRDYQTTQGQPQRVAEEISKQKRPEDNARAWASHTEPCLWQRVWPVFLPRPSWKHQHDLDQSRPRCKNVWVHKRIAPVHLLDPWLKASLCPISPMEGF